MSRKLSCFPVLRLSVSGLYACLRVCMKSVSESSWLSYMMSMSSIYRLYSMMCCLCVVCFSSRSSFCFR